MDKYRKALIAGLTFVLTVVTQIIDAGLVTDVKWTTYLQMGIALAGFYGVYAVRNAPPATPSGGLIPPTGGGTGAV